MGFPPSVAKRNHRAKEDWDCRRVFENGAVQPVIFRTVVDFDTALCFGPVSRAKPPVQGEVLSDGK